MFKLKWMTNLKDVGESVKRLCLRFRRSVSLLPAKKT